MLHRSQAAVCAWEKGELVGFGRATSDGLFRAVLWDVVVAESHQGKGLGRCIVKNLLQTKSLRSVERIYLMTTKSEGFYERLGFESVGKQRLMLLENH
jgi:N-acetylglutamate synthase-like GNAT family acetyltransferase